MGKRTEGKNLTAEQLKANYPSPNGEWFGEHPFWTIAEWQNEVGSGGARYCDTTSSYWDWVETQIMLAVDDGEEEDDDE